MDNLTKEVLDDLAECIKDLCCITNEDSTKAFIILRLGSIYNKADRAQDRLRLEG